MVHRVTGELFLASSDELVGRLSYAHRPDRVVIDLSAAHLCDASSVAALDALGTEYAQRGKTAETAETAETAGLNEPGARMHKTPSGELAGG
ncbi:hypothetical protein GCM10010287_40750 [Streptomyces variabilis]|uniref:STAS domain-containing protein n=1 Tax=Streptomyces variabilis TaxID=67372 RepID=A0ABQ2U195_9ACTN|nr:hypothetical protein GCM10010265_50080 [Streptomyces griseoincarnatus]GGT61980.1 hypothetical protein GCM10010287_40750 [Streptomyces variabilis]